MRKCAMRAATNRLTFIRMIFSQARRVSVIDRLQLASGKCFLTQSYQPNVVTIFPLVSLMIVF
ncbi:hypothetical protein AAKU55_004162 [Oxalobacteraceae bacterium GrIS 1.11]